MNQNKDRYIQFYTPGSAAVKVQVQNEETWAPLPEYKPKKKLTLYIDPVAVIGFAVAVCMVILLSVGVTRLSTARREVTTLEHYVAQLTAENRALEETYQAGYDLNDVKREAHKLGMVSAEEVEHRVLYVTMPHVDIVQEPTLWERVATFLTGLFT